METLKNLTLVQWIGIVIGLNSLLMGATPQLTVLFGATAVPIILAVATLGNGALGVFVTVIGGLGTQALNVVAGGASLAVGANAKPSLATLAMDPAQQKIDAAPGAAAAVAAIAKAAAVLLFAIFAVGLVSVQPASAQLRPLTGNLKKDLAPAARTAPAPLAGLQGFMDQLSKIQTKLVDDTVADMTAADGDAATLINPSDPTSFRDPISHACYPAAIKFLQSLPASTAPTGTLIAVQLFQKKRDFVAQIQAGLPVYLKLGCAPLLGDEAAIFTKLMGLLGVNVALNAILPGSGALSALAF